MMRPPPTCVLGLRKETLSDWLSHDLPPEEEADLAEHIPTCQACQATITRYRHVSTALRAQPIPDIGQSMWQEIRPQLPHRARHRLRRMLGHQTLGRTVAGVVAVSIVAAFLAIFTRLRTNIPATTVNCTNSTLSNLGVFVVRDDGSVQAFAANDGSQIWRTPPHAVVGNIAAPVLVGGVLLAPSLDGVLVALHPADGAPLWNTQTTSGLQPAWQAIDDHSVATISQDGTGWFAAALHVASGTTAWRTPLTAPGFTPKQLVTLTVANGTVAVLVSGTASTGNVYEVFALRASDGLPLWPAISLFMPQNIFGASLLVAPDTIYVLVNKLYAIALTDGHSLWTNDTLAQPSNVSLALAALGANVLVQTSDHLIALQRSDGAQVWSQPDSPSNVTLNGQAAYIGAANSQQLLAVDAATGTLLWQSSPANALPITPVTVGCHFVIAAGGETVQAFNQTNGQKLWGISAPLGFATKAAIAGDAVVLGLPTLQSSTILAAYQLHSGDRLWSHTGTALADSALNLTVGPRT